MIWLVSELPTVSVIIPARGAGESLPETLAAIAAQTYRNVIEVIVAAADEESRSAARGATVVDNPTGSTPAGLNLALAASTGDVIVRCDAHAVLPSEYIERAVELLGESGAANVGGMQVPVGTTPWEEAIAYAMTSPLGAGDARYRTGGDAGPVETVYLGVFRREALVAAGGYDEAFWRNQDYELNHRLIDAGHTVWFDPELRVTYRPRGSLSELAGQYFAYGRSKRLFSRKHPGDLRLRQWAPPGLVLVLVVSLLASLVAPILILTPLIYLAVLTATEFVRGAEDPLRVAAALATMHVSWGVGFLRG
jgi:glycosyltransferase involved in cell wall biosynthesis